jgi:hypothetical protein
MNYKQADLLGIADPDRYHETQRVPDLQAQDLQNVRRPQLAEDIGSSMSQNAISQIQDQRRID